MSRLIDCKKEDSFYVFAELMVEVEENLIPVDILLTSSSSKFFHKR